MSFYSKKKITSGMLSVELLLTITIIGLSFLMVVLFIDRTLAIYNARDLVRFNSVQVILSSLLQYQIDNAGLIPPQIDALEDSVQMILTEDGVCDHYCPNSPNVVDCVSLPELTPKYVESIPQESFFTDVPSSGYYINKFESNTLLVGSCITENHSSITIKQ